MRTRCVAVLLAAAPALAVSLATAAPAFAAPDAAGSATVAPLTWPDDAQEVLPDEFWVAMEELRRLQPDGSPEGPFWEDHDSPVLFDEVHHNDGWHGQREEEHAPLEVSDGPAAPVAPSSLSEADSPPAAPVASETTLSGPAQEVLPHSAPEPAVAAAAPDARAADPEPAAPVAVSSFLTELPDDEPAPAFASGSDPGSPLGVLALLGALCVVGAAAAGRMSEPSASAEFRRDVRRALRTRKPTVTP
jgi:hypothetical protein